MRCKVKIVHNETEITVKSSTKSLITIVIDDRRIQNWT